MQWTSANDKLPPVGVQVLCIVKLEAQNPEEFYDAIIQLVLIRNFDVERQTSYYDATIAFMDNNDKTALSIVPLSQECILYWMELPKFPDALNN